MLKIDSNLLKDIGLDDLPDEEKQKLLLQIYETLELQVGTKLSEQMDVKQLEEFEGLIENEEFAKDYLNAKSAGFETTEEFKKFVSQNKDNEESVVSQYAALKWLEEHFPNYQKVVESELKKIKEEVKKDAPKIRELASEN